MALMNKSVEDHHDHIIRNEIVLTFDIEDYHDHIISNEISSMFTNNVDSRLFYHNGNKTSCRNSSFREKHVCENYQHLNVAIDFVEKRNTCDYGFVTKQS